MNRKLFIMGAPNAGKSTFLAALWHSLTQKIVETELTLKELRGDTSYLYGIQNKWLEVEQLERTVIGQEQEQLSIILTDGIGDLELEFPDLSGETFQSIYNSREMSIELKERIIKSDAILYFINVEDIHSSELISNIPTHLRDEGNDISKREDGSQDPTQVQIIDLLQVIIGIKKEIKLGIIFSAWDRVLEEENKDVRLFLKKQMNMLWQYLEANSEVIHTTVWGVSAIGGTIKDSEELLAVEEQIKRIIVVNEEKESSYDLTRIIKEMSGEI